MAGGPLLAASDPFELGGTRRCRPATHFTYDLEQANLKVPHISVEAPETAGDCFTRLVKGQVDVVTLAKREAERAVRELGVGEQVVETGKPASVETLHAVTPESNRKGARLLALIDRGLAQVMVSGEWFKIVALHNTLQGAPGN